MADWEPASEAEASLRDALRTGDQELYFRILSRMDLLLPVSPDAAAGQAPMGWGTWTTGGRTHLLAFTTPQAMHSCLAEHVGSARKVAYRDLAEAWPNNEWWLAINPGLPIEGYLPAWFVTQLARGDVRLPGRTIGARARVEAATRPRGAATIPTQADPLPHRPVPQPGQVAAPPGPPHMVPPQPAPAPVSPASLHPPAPFAPPPPPPVSEPGSFAPESRSFASEPAPFASESRSFGPESAPFAPERRSFGPPPPASEPGPFASEPPPYGARLARDGDRPYGAGSSEPRYGTGGRYGAPAAPEPYVTPAAYAPPPPVPEPPFGRSAPDAPYRGSAPDSDAPYRGSPPDAPYGSPSPPRPPEQAPASGPPYTWDRMSSGPGGTDAPPVRPEPGSRAPAEPPEAPPTIRAYAPPAPISPEQAPSSPGGWAPMAPPSTGAPLPVRVPGTPPPPYPGAPGYPPATTGQPTPAPAPVEPPEPETPLASWMAQTPPDPVPASAPRPAAPPEPSPAPAPLAPAPPAAATPAPDPAFEPANDLETELLAAAAEGHTDSFLSTLLLAKVLLPVAPGASTSVRPGDPAFEWRREEVDDQPYVVVFTSRERMGEHLSEVVPALTTKFVQLIRVWPDETWSFAVNPGSPVGATLPGSQIKALAAWAAEVGLSDEPSVEFEPIEEPAAPQPSAAAERPVVMQKPVAPTQVAYFLDRGYDRVSGFVHRASEVAHLTSPEQLYAALGLGYAGSPFKPADEEMYVLRWTAYRPNLYRIPYGGRDEAGMRAMQGWMIERSPFRGNGFAPGESDDVIAEFKVDSARLPHNAQMWRITREGRETLIALLDADGPRWARTDPDSSADGEERD